MWKQRSWLLAALRSQHLFSEMSFNSNLSTRREQETWETRCHYSRLPKVRETSGNVLVTIGRYWVVHEIKSLKFQHNEVPELHELFSVMNFHDAEELHGVVGSHETSELSIEHSVALQSLYVASIDCAIHLS